MEALKLAFETFLTLPAVPAFWAAPGCSTSLCESRLGILEPLRVVNRLRLVRVNHLAPRAGERLHDIGAAVRVLLGSMAADKDGGWRFLRRERPNFVEVSTGLPVVRFTCFARLARA